MRFVVLFASQTAFNSIQFAKTRCISLLLFWALIHVANARKGLPYHSSYAYLSVRNRKTGMERVFCVNYQQWLTKEIAPTIVKASPVNLSWWGDSVNNTNVCVENKRKFLGSAVALNYRLKKQDGKCAEPFVATAMGYKAAVQFVFSEFYDPNINRSTELPIFFIYRHVFFNEVIVLSEENRRGTDLSLYFYRPPSSTWDISLPIMWLLAIFCVVVGGFWAAHRKKCQERSVVLDGAHPTGHEGQRAEGHSSEKGQVKLRGDCLSVIACMLIVTSTVIVGFYFRIVLVHLTNATVVFFGAYCVCYCFSCFIGVFCRCSRNQVHLSVNDVIRLVSSHDPLTYEFCAHRPTVVTLILFPFSAVLCTFWFFVRHSHYAFIILDFINVNICLYILKSIRCANLKWLTVFLLCMFIYDVFMVFGTPYLTKDKCSVMIEIATGTACSKTNADHLLGLVNREMPEKLPVAFVIPRLNGPMMRCLDLEIEKEFHPVMLGLGDVLVPGFLISHCFTLDFDFRKRYLYGTCSLIGYGTGCVIATIALVLMEVAQPALLYLIPFTLFPVIILAFTRKELNALWTGNFTKKEGSPTRTGPAKESVLESMHEIESCSMSAFQLREEP